MTSITTGKSFFNATIESGDTESDAVELDNFVFCGFITPSVLTGTSFTFKGSIDGENFYTIKSTDDSTISATVSTSSGYSLNLIDFVGWKQIKIVSGATETGNREIKILGTRALNAR